MLESGEVAITSDEQVISVSEVAALKKPINELERVPGKKLWKFKYLKLLWSRDTKKLISHAPLPGVEDFP